MEGWAYGLLKGLIAPQRASVEQPAEGGGCHCAEICSVAGWREEVPWFLVRGYELGLIFNLLGIASMELSIVRRSVAVAVGGGRVGW